MAKPLRVLILEDRQADAELMLRELRRGGYKPSAQIVQTEADFASHLEPSLDIILADYRLPQWTAHRALQLLNERNLDIPLIVVSGTLGDEEAAECIKQGARDYLLKDRLTRLGQAVANALEQKRLRDEAKRAGEELHVRARQQTAIAEFGQYALSHKDLSEVMNRAVAVVARTLNVRYCKVLELLPDRRALIVRAGIGWKPGYVGHATVESGRRSQAGYTLLSDHPVIVEDFHTETRFLAPPLLEEHDVVSGISVIISTNQEPFGVLGAHHTAPRKFSELDANFLTVIANSLAAAIVRTREEDKFRLLVDSAPDATVIVDEEGRIVLVNALVSTLFGYSREELLGQPIEILVPERFRASHVGHRQRYLAAPTVRPMGTNLCLFGLRRDGSELPVEVSLSPIHTNAGLLIASSIRDITDRKRSEQERERLLEQVRRDQERLRALSRHLLNVQETERRAIARELHDELGQLLTALKTTLQTARQREPATSGMALDEGIGLADRMLDRVRTLSLNLRPPLLDELGLGPVIRSYVETEARRAGLEVDLVIEPMETRMQPEVEIACFRVAQEAVTNVIRHARAHRIAVRLRRSPATLELSAQDDGIGFDVPTALRPDASGANLGLLGMFERVEALGGMLSIHSAAGRGTEVRASFPLQSNSRTEAPSP